MKFQSVRGVTWTVPCLAKSRRAFEDCLGFVTLDSGRVSEGCAQFWDSPRAEGCRYAVLQPESGARVFVRLVEAPIPDDYAPLRSFGWNAVEFHVRDIEGLSKRLENSPFEVIGPPRDLMDNNAVIAMQVLGPGQEFLYLTEMRHEGLRKTFGQAQCEVDRAFITVLGVSDQPRTIDFYAPFAVRMNIRKQFRITGLARAHGLDPERARFDIASVVMTQAFRIETDAYPDTAAPRSVTPGLLAPGLAMVSVVVTDADKSLDWQTLRGFEECEESMALLIGPDGEFIELLDGDRSGFDSRVYT